MSDAQKKWQAESVQLYLRIKHPTIDPAEITRTFDLPPEHSVQAGTNVSAQGVKRLHSETYWLASLRTQSLAELTAWTRPAAQASPQEMSSKLRSLRMAHATGLEGMQVLLWLRKLETQHDFIQRINLEGGSITLVLQRPDRDSPFNVSPLLAQRLAELEIGLEID